MTKVRAILSTARGFANAVNRQAVKSKEFAEELVFKHGIRGEITPKALEGITKDFYDKSGRLTEQGRKEIQEVLRNTGLTEKATWDEVLQAVIKSKQEAAKRIELELAKLKEIPTKFAKKVLPKDFDFSASIEKIARKRNPRYDNCVSSISPEWQRKLAEMKKNVEFTKIQ